MSNLIDTQLKYSSQKKRKHGTREIPKTIHSGQILVAYQASSILNWKAACRKDDL